MRSSHNDVGSETRTLPHLGQLTLKELLAALQASVRSADTFDVRVVAVEDPEPTKWSIFAGEVQVADSAVGTSQVTVISAGPIRLVRYQGGVDALASEATFWRFARRWHEVITSQPNTAEAQTTLSIQRIGSRSDLGELPEWRFALYAVKAGGASPLLPKGPFYSRAQKFFAATLGDAAAQWLERPMLRNLTSPQFHLDVVLRDPRGYLGNVTLADTGISMDVHGTLPRERLSVVVLAEALDGTRHESVVDSPEARVHAQLPSGDLRSLQLFVLGAEGECLDEFYEDQYRCTRSQRVLGSALSPSHEDEVERAMELGEGETIEFKAMIPAGRGATKSRELLEVACAFANTHGGHLFIGISDNVQVVGLEKILIRAAEGDLAKGREGYATAIKRMIQEGLTPSVSAEIGWLTVAGHDVLRVAIQGHPTHCHALVESGDIYVRRGASCAKARPSDLELKFGRSASEFLGKIRRLR